MNDRHTLIVVGIVGTLLMLAVPVARIRAAGENTPVTTNDRASSASSTRSVMPNGSFEHWTDGEPVTWHADSGTLLPDGEMKMQGRRSVCIQVDPNDTIKRPYYSMTSESLRLEPNMGYRLRLWLASSFKGRVEVIVHSTKRDRSIDERGRVTGRHTWSDEFYWYTTTGSPWVPAEVSFMTDDSTDYRVKVLATPVKANRNDKTWVDDVRIEKSGSVKAPATEEENTRGFQLFTRSVMKSYGLEKLPPNCSEIADGLYIRLARGEYEPALLGLHALQNLENIDLSLVGDLKGPGKGTFPKNNVVIRRLDGALLPISGPRVVGAGETAGWWVTAKAESNAVAGVYDGKLAVRVSGEVIAEFPISVEVMDITLPDPDIAFLLYHHEAYFPPEFLTAKLRAAYYKDMLEHGMNTVTVYNTPWDGEKIDVSRNHSKDYDEDSPMSSVGLDLHMKEILDSGLCATGQPVFWLPLSFGSKATMKTTLEHWKNHQWPTPLLYVNDEPGGTGPKAERALAQLKEIRSWGIPVKTTTAGLDPRTGVLGQFYDVWVIGDRGIHYENYMNAQRLGCELWQYNSNTPHENMPFVRAFYGFCPFRTGVKGVAYWAYYDARTWFADSQGNAQESLVGRPNKWGDLRCDPDWWRLSLVCPSHGGPIPTLAWEAIREGVDDYRYCQLFQSLLDETEKQTERLTAEVDTLLSKEDRDQLKRREDEDTGPHDPANPRVAWKPTDAKQAKGEEIFLQWRALDHQLRRAKEVRMFVIESIPFDIGVARLGAKTLHATRSGKYCPPLAMTDVGEDPFTITETKRRIVTSSIIRLHDALQGSEQIEASRN